jgi:hypothetical protein
MVIQWRGEERYEMGVRGVNRVGLREEVGKGIGFWNWEGGEDDVSSVEGETEGVSEGWSGGGARYVGSEAEVFPAEANGGCEGEA